MSVKRFVKELFKKPERDEKHNIKVYLHYLYIFMCIGLIYSYISGIIYYKDFFKPTLQISICLVMLTLMLKFNVIKNIIKEKKNKNITTKE